jgi:diguanylate cyclase (GGDEF)-like protein
MLDADQFKGLNDTAGHQAGDEVLKRIVAEAKGILRSSDIVARLGGEEFILLLPSTTSNEAAAAAERVRAAVESAYVDTRAGPLQAAVSLGVASLGHTTMTLESYWQSPTAPSMRRRVRGETACVSATSIMLVRFSIARSAKTVKRRQTYSLVTARKRNNRTE